MSVKLPQNGCFLYLNFNSLLDPINNISIHFEPQFNLLNGAFTIPIHYEINPYDTEKWAINNIDPADYQAYRLVREYISLAVSSICIDNYMPGGGSNQIGKAAINIENTTVAQFHKKFATFLEKSSTAIDKALNTVRTWKFDIRKLIIFVDEIASKCKAKGYLFEPQQACSTEYGIYLKDQNGKNALWIGIWCSYWYKYGVPISLAVHETDSSWSPKSLKILNSKQKSTETFEGYSTYSFPLDSYEESLVDSVMTIIESHMFALSV